MIPADVALAQLHRETSELARATDEMRTGWGAETLGRALADRWRQHDEGRRGAHRTTAPADAPYDLTDPTDPTDDAERRRARDLARQWAEGR